MKRRIVEELFPPIKPYHSELLLLGDGHQIYYEECGNPNGVPVLYIHGGPGAGCDAGARRFFDPKKCHVILFDQRGSGRSRPYTSTYANTTEHLVKDIDRLLCVLKKDKVVLFGGSWGSTLALVYAIAHPEKVLGMILRGIFLAEKRECADYLSGQQKSSRFPEIRDRFLEKVPISARGNPADYYFAMMISDDQKVRREYAYAWTYYEYARLQLTPSREKDLRKEILAESYVSLAILEAHYIRNFCFLEDGFILNHTHRILDIPTSIIHGRYDDVCQVENAIRLHKELPESKLHIVVAGHARSDSEIRKKLISETDAMVSRFMK
ncbi:MAG: prolyl aminopeptidase [Parcubacteria group bacterium]|nr:prolyl aminopeptidase [Parcubacteria group bacterium]